MASKEYLKLQGLALQSNFQSYPFDMYEFNDYTSWYLAYPCSSQLPRSISILFPERKHGRDFTGGGYGCIWGRSVCVRPNFFIIC